MGDKGQETSQPARTTTSPNTFWKDLAELLKAHQEVLPSLPEMCERFAEIECKWTTGTELQTSDMCRPEELTVLDKRKKADLKKQFDLEMTVKRERITSLERESKQKDKEIERIKKQNEELKKEIDEKEEKIKEYSKRNVLVERELQEKEREVALAKKEKDNLLKQNEEKEEKVKECSERNTRLEGELQEKDKEVALAKKELAQAKEDFQVTFSAKDTELNKMISRNRQSRERYRERLIQQNEEMNKLKSRVAYLSEKQVKKDQRQVEDTTSSNRPSEVEKDFAAFCDEDRLDACDKIQETYGSEEDVDVTINYPRLACTIFETAYEEMKENRDAVAELFCKIIGNMIANAPVMGRKYCSWKESGVNPSQVTLDVAVCSQHLGNQSDVLDTLMLSLKESSHLCNLEPLQERVTSKVTEKWQTWLTRESSCTFSVSKQVLQNLNDYIRACIRLSWRIVTQVPPMQIEYHSSILRNIHKNMGYHIIPERRPTMQPGDEQLADDKLRIACYLWPGLFDGGGRLIRAGEVLCKYEEA